MLFGRIICYSVKLFCQFPDQNWKPKKALQAYIKEKYFQFPDYSCTYFFASIWFPSGKGNIAFFGLPIFGLLHGFLPVILMKYTFLSAFLSFCIHSFVAICTWLVHITAQDALMNEFCITVPTFNTVFP